MKQKNNYQDIIKTKMLVITKLVSSEQTNEVEKFMTGKCFGSTIGG